MKKHHVIADDLKSIPEQLKQAIAIMKSDRNSSHLNAYIFITERIEFENKKEKPIIIALALTQNSDGFEIVYAKKQSQIERDLNNILYWDKEKGQSFL